MSKVSAPGLSLNARGSIADAISYSRRRKTNIIEKKPVPTIKHTLPQTYQRWLYQDYAHYWTLQSEATRRTYAAAGSRHHLTGFQYWMSYHLAKLPDIAGYWKLDTISAVISPDSSKNDNDGTIIGAISTPGLIAQALSYDGINDRVDCGTDSSLDLDELTVECFVYPLDKAHSATNSGLISHGSGRDEGYQLAQRLDVPRDNVHFNFMTDAGTNFFSPWVPINQWYHILYTITGTDKWGWLNGVRFGPGLPANPIVKSFQTTYVGYGSWGLALHGYIDQAIIYNRVLDDLTIQRHSARRFLL